MASPSFGRAQRLFQLGFLLTALKAYFLENKVFYCNALAYNGQNSLQQYMFDYLCSIFAQNARELKADIPAEEAAKIGQFFPAR